MNFWSWLVHVGLIEGDPNYYASGKATAGEITHAIRTAINNLQFASDPTAKQEFYKRLQAAGGLLETDDINYYISGQATEAEIENLITKASERLGPKTGGAGADAGLPLHILSSPSLQWFRDTKTGRFYAQYTMPGGLSKVLFEAEEEQIQALFGTNQPPQFQNFDFTSYLDQSGVFFGGNVAEVEGQGSWENEVKYTISIALDQQDLPDWIKNDQQARDLLWVAVTEDRTDEWFYSQLSKLDSFKQRYPGVQALMGKGLTVLEAVRTHTEYEIKLKTLHAAAGFSADAITPQIVGQVLAKGYSIEDVQNSYATWKRMNDYAPALAAFNEVLASQGKNPLTGADLYAFLSGQAPAEIYDIYEASAIREAATAAGFGDIFSADDALNLALQTQQDLTVDQAYQQFTQVAVQALRFRHELNVNQFGLDIEDLIDLSFGRAPRSGKGPAEIAEAMARITASAQASLQGRVNPYVGFTPEGRPQAQSLGGLRQQQ